MGIPVFRSPSPSNDLSDRQKSTRSPIRRRPSIHHHPNSRPRHGQIRNPRRLTPAQEHAFLEQQHRDLSRASRANMPLYGAPVPPPPPPPPPVPYIHSTHGIVPTRPLSHSPLPMTREPSRHSGSENTLPSTRAAIRARLERDLGRRVRLPPQSTLRETRRLREQQDRLDVPRYRRDAYGYAGEVENAAVDRGERVSRIERLARPRSRSPLVPASHERSPDVISDDLDHNDSTGWETILQTITPDENLPSVESSFTSAAASASFTTRSRERSRVPETGSSSTSGEGSATSFDTDPTEIAVHAGVDGYWDGHWENPECDMELLARENTPPERSSTSRSAGTSSRATHPSAAEIQMDQFRVLVQQLASRDDIPDEFWESWGLTPNFAGIVERGRRERERDAAIANSEGTARTTGPRL